MLRILRVGRGGEPPSHMSLMVHEVSHVLEMIHVFQVSFESSFFHELHNYSDFGIFCSIPYRHIPLPCPFCMYNSRYLQYIYNCGFIYVHIYSVVSKFRHEGFLPNIEDKLVIQIPNLVSCFLFYLANRACMSSKNR